MNEKMRGYVYTLEVLLAVAIIMGALIFLYKTPPVKPRFEISTIKLQGMQALEYIDKKEDLRRFAIVSNQSDIEKRLTAVLVRAIDFDIDVCTLTCNDTAVPKNKTVVSVDYYIAGYRNAYNITKIKLWMWRK